MMENLKLKISSDNKIIPLCIDFATKRMNQPNNYDNGDPEKVYTAALRGAIAEWCVSGYFNKRLHIHCSKPDLNIYEGPADKQLKCSGADLVANTYGDIHIKTCQPFQDQENSWVYNKKANYFYSDIHAFTTFQLRGSDYVVEIIGLFYGSSLRGMYKPPKLLKYRKTKICIYENDLVGLVDVMTGKVYGV